MSEGNLVAQALDKIDKWLKQSGMKESRLGLLACANARAVQRVRDKSASIETLEHLLAYIEKNPAKGSPASVTNYLNRAKRRRKG